VCWRWCLGEAVAKRVVGIGSLHSHSCGRGGGGERLSPFPTDEGVTKLRLTSNPHISSRMGGEGRAGGQTAGGDIPGMRGENVTAHLMKEIREWPSLVR